MSIILSNFHAFKNRKLWWQFWLVQIHCGSVSSPVTVLRSNALPTGTTPRVTTFSCWTVETLKSLSFSWQIWQLYLECFKLAEFCVNVVSSLIMIKLWVWYSSCSYDNARQNLLISLIFPFIFIIFFLTRGIKFVLAHHC